MKRGAYVFVFVLLIALVVAQEQSGDSPTGDVGVGPTDEKKGIGVVGVKAGTEDVKKGLDKIKDVGLKESSDFFEREIDVSFLRTFGIENGVIKLNDLIVFISFVVILFVIVLGISFLIPFFDKEILSGTLPFEIKLNFLITIVFVLVMMVTGTVYQVSNNLSNFLKSFEFVTRLGDFQAALWVLVAVVLVVISFKLSSWIGRGDELEEAKKMGERVRTADRVNKYAIEDSGLE